MVCLQCHWLKEPETQSTLLTHLTVFPNQMFVHYWRNFKNRKFFVTHDTGKSKVHCFYKCKSISMRIQTQCWCTENTFKIKGDFFYCQCGKRQFSHFMSDSCQTPWQIMHVLTFLFKMRVLENAGKLMNHGITRYSFMARDSSVLPRFIEERQLQPER